jgi:lytic murein transglycosylase
MRIPYAIALAAFLPFPAAAQSCGGDFRAFVGSLADEARARGHDAASIERFFAGVRQDPAVIRADRAQGVFQMPFIDFSRRLISQNRVQNGARLSERYDQIFDRIERDYGVSRGVLLAFWAFETDFGQVQGDFNTVDALVTLAHDCRRPDLFRPQVFSALELASRGWLDPRSMTGAWAGEIGQVQMLPGDIIESGVDGDEDGRIDLKGSVPDALLSGGAMLSRLGWRPGEPWLQEVTLPADFPWEESGLNHRRPSAEWVAMGVSPRWGEIADLPAAIVLPQGRGGPAFIAYPNFDVFFEWNQSFVYVTTAAYFATRLEGAPVYAAGNPAPGLGEAEMKALQQRLQALGHDVGEVDGILGERTREAVQAEQRRLGLPADAWPTAELLRAL